MMQEITDVAGPRDYFKAVEVLHYREAEKIRFRWLEPDRIPLLILGLVFVSLIMAGCAKKQFNKVANGFRAIGVGMTRAQVMERIKSDDRFGRVLQPDKTRLITRTKIDRYDAAVDLCFNSADVLQSIRISIGEAGGEHYLADQPIRYIHNILKAKLGMPTVGSDKVHGLDMFTWEGYGARWTLFAIKYRISAGRYLVLFISDPKQPTEEETGMRHFQSIDKNFFQEPRFPEEHILSNDF